VTALETTREVVVAIVVAIVVATARCTRVATSTEFKPELNKSPFTKNNFFDLNEPIRLRFFINRSRFTPFNNVSRIQ
jgi:hypothetical protein